MFLLDKEFPIATFWGYPGREVPHVFSLLTQANSRGGTGDVAHLERMERLHHGKQNRDDDPHERTQIRYIDCENLEPHCFRKYVFIRKTVSTSHINDIKALTAHDHARHTKA